MREALNTESGLNDGICVPIVVLLLGFAVETQTEHSTMIHAGKIVVEELGIGLAVGLVLTGLTVRLLRFAAGKGWISEHWEDVPIVALAAACLRRHRRSAAAGLSPALSVGCC